MAKKCSFKSSVSSRIFGAFASKKFSKPVQKFVNETYVKLMKVDLSDFDEASSYTTLNALFTRKPKKARSFQSDDDAFISPADSFISACGKIEDAKALQIKGFEYRVGELLGYYIQKSEKAKIQDGEYINFYLSPKDYHRYHAPFDMKIQKAVHIPGKLYPVNFAWLRKIPELFVENERVVLECYTKENRLFFMVFVGALNVGKMLFNFDSRIQTNAKAGCEKLYMYKDVELKKGEELGRFEMGSTIVMLFEKDMVELTCKETAVRFSDEIARLKA